jgi:hypothetical protein
VRWKTSLGKTEPVNTRVDNDKSNLLNLLEYPELLQVKQFQEFKSGERRLMPYWLPSTDI